MQFFNGSKSLFSNIKTDTVHTTGCSKCGAYLSCKNGRLDGVVGSNDILLILPLPNVNEDNRGYCGCGEEYEWLADQLNEVGISFKQCSRINVIGCRTKNLKAFDMCRQRVDAFVNKVKPKLVIAFGSDTLSVTVGREWTRSLGDIQKWHSFCIPFRYWNNGTWLVHAESPSEIVLSESFYKNEKWKNAESFYEKAEAVCKTGFYRMHTRVLKEGIRDAYRKCKEPIPVRPESTIKPHVLNEADALVFLEKNYQYLKNNPDAILTFDLETNMIKAYNNNARVYSIAVLADKSLGSAAFRCTPATKEAFVKLFTLRPKVNGANVKFDFVWNVVKLGMNPADFKIYFDTVLMAHLLDNRDGITSLKFNTYRFFGITYESEAHKYFESDGGCNSENKIFEAPEHTILYYNALDVIYTDAVMQEQEKLWTLEDNPKKEFARKLYLEASIALAKMEIVGVPMDLNKIQESKKFCMDKIKEIEDTIKDDPVWKEWGEYVGVDKRSILSEAQIVDFFIKHKKLHPIGISKKAKPKADHEWLTKMLDQEPFLQYVLDYRKYTKMLSTYIKGYETELNDDGRIRSFYTLNNVSSFRSASNSPNGQNQSSRDMEQVSLLKSCYIPPSGWYITCYDFSGLENAVSGNITQDDYMLGCVDGSVDCHRANAEQAFFFDEGEYDALKKYDEESHTKHAKTARNGGKSLSFQVLYGQAKQVVATTLWKYMDDKNVHVSPTETAKERVIKRLNMEQKYSQAIKKNKDLDKNEYFYEIYEDFIQTVIDDFWNNRFSKTNEWRENTFETLLKTGKIHYPTGLTVRGLGSRNFFLNAPIQGSGNCCTLLSLVLLTQEAEKRGFRGRPCMQIHDDIVSLVPPEELDEYLALQKYIMEVRTKEVFKWLSVPLMAEAEITSTNWAEKKEYSNHLELYKKKYLNQ